MIVGTLSAATDATGRQFVSDIGAATVLGLNQVQLVAMPVGFGPFVFDPGTNTAVAASFRGARLPRDIIVDLNNLTAAQQSLVLSNLNGAASGAGTPPKWQFATNPATWSVAPIFRNYSGTMQKESLFVGVAFYIIENPRYLSSGVVASGVNIAGDQ